METWCGLTPSLPTRLEKKFTSRKVSRNNFNPLTLVFIRNVFVGAS